MLCMTASNFLTSSLLLVLVTLDETHNNLLLHGFVVDVVVDDDGLLCLITENSWILHLIETRLVLKGREHGLGWRDCCHSWLWLFYHSTNVDTVFFALQFSSSHRFIKNGCTNNQSHGTETTNSSTGHIRNSDQQLHLHNFNVCMPEAAGVCPSSLSRRVSLLVTTNCWTAGFGQSQSKKLFIGLKMLSLSSSSKYSEEWLCSSESFLQRYQAEPISEAVMFRVTFGEGIPSHFCWAIA